MLPNPEMINKREVLPCLWHHFYSLWTILLWAICPHSKHHSEWSATSEECSYSATKQENLQTWTRMYCCFCVSVGLTKQNIVPLGEPGCVVHILNVCCGYDYSKVTNCFQNTKLVKQWFRVFKKNEKSHQELVTEFSLF